MTLLWPLITGEDLGVGHNHAVVPLCTGEDLGVCSIAHSYMLWFYCTLEELVCSIAHLIHVVVQLYTGEDLVHSSTYVHNFCLGTEVPRRSAGVVRTGYVISSMRAQCELTIVLAIKIDTPKST